MEMDFCVVFCDSGANHLIAMLSPAHPISVFDAGCQPEN
jgi:hypothetical protein